MDIDKKKYELSDVNFHKKKTEKTQIVLSFSLRKDNYHIKRLKTKELGTSKQWNMFTISRDGEIYQHFDPKYYSKYIGDKNGNKLAITIVLENMGSLIKLDDDRFVNWLNEPCEKEKVVERNWVGYTYWENIPEVQLKKTAELCSKLCNDFDIPKTCIEFRHYHKDIKKFKGIVFRGNYFDDSGDLNPLFNINKFSEMLDDE